MSRRNKLNALIANLKPCVGVIDWLQAAKQMRLKLAIASGSPREWIIRHLERANLVDFFDDIISIEDVFLPTPHPDIYNLALERLGVSFNEAIAIEDSPSGVASALAARLRCVVVPNQITSNLSFSSEVCRLESLEQFSLLKALELFDKYSI